MVQRLCVVPGVRVEQRLRLVQGLCVEQGGTLVEHVATGRSGNDTGIHRVLGSERIDGV